MEFEVFGGRDPRYLGGIVRIDELYQVEASQDPEPTRIGVVDTGIVVEGGAPPNWAANRIEWGDGDVDEFPSPSDPTLSPLAGHGTFVCGLVLAAAPHSRLRMMGVINGSEHDEDADVAAAITALADDGIKLINLSFGGTTGEWVPPEGIENALDALDDDVVVVAAAGNDGTHQRLFPAGIRPARARMVSVGAVDENAEVPQDRLPPVADFSNHWPGLSVFASGVGLIGPHAGGRSAARSGTSFAAALVTGRIAALAHEEGIPVREAADRLLENTRTISVHTVNGPHQTPYLKTDAALLRRSR